MTNAGIKEGRVDVSGTKEAETLVKEGTVGGGMAGHRRGFVFTLDAFLSVFILIALAASVFYFSSQSSVNSFSGVQEKRLASDALRVMALSGSLESQNESVWQNELAFFLAGSGLSYNLTVETYSTALSPIGAKSVRQGNASNKDEWVAKTHFASFANGAISNFTIARLRVWR